MKQNKFDVWIEKTRKEVDREPLNDKEIGLQCAIMIVYECYKTSNAIDELKDKKPVSLNDLKSYLKK